MDDLGVASGELTWLLKMAIESSLVYLLKMVDLSIVLLVYQRVTPIKSH